MKNSLFLMVISVLAGIVGSGLMPLAMAVAPDYVVSAVTLNPTAPAAGETFTATVTVKNQGTAVGRGKQVTVWAHQPTTQSCGARGDQTNVVDILAAGGSTTLTFNGLSSGAAGTKILRAYVNNTCAMTEANANNNQLTVSYQVGTPAQSDFVVTQMVLFPESPLPNSLFNAVITVKNQGMAAGNGGQLTVWSNQSLSKSCNINGDQSVSVGTLAAGESKDFTVTGLVAGAAGDKTLRAFVDSTCTIAESAEDNQMTLSYRVATVLADFAVTNITLTPASSGATFDALLTVVNQGQVSANGGQLTVWTNRVTAPSCRASGDRTVAVGEIAAGSSAVVTVNGLAAGASAGERVLYAFVESNCALLESNETNNQLTKNYSVVGRADLVVTGITLSPVSPAPNTTFSAVVTVKNQGTASSNETPLTIWANQAITQTCGMSGDQAVLVKALAPAANTTITISGLSADVVGSKTVRVFVDSDCLTSEANEDNNQLAQTYTVKDPNQAQGPEPLTGMIFVAVPAGNFSMGCGAWQSDCYGDEKPTVAVTVKAFEMGKYEVTQGQWQAVMGNNPSYFESCGDNCPVETVSWYDSQAFIEELNTNDSGCTYRLPTEAEWEYACRSGGKNEQYCGGSDVNAVAWYSNNSGGKTHAVGGKAANNLGIYDMSGNVWEWTCSWRGSYGDGQKNHEKCTGNGSYRVDRGGSWYAVPAYVRSASRSYGGSSGRGNGLGLRLARICP